MQGPFADAPYVGGVSSIGVLNVNQGMLRTEVLHEVGGFSEDFRDYGIDPDLTTKVLLAGYDIAYTKCVALHHYRDWGPDPDSPRFKEQMERQASYQRAYREKYGEAAAGGAAWTLKRVAWALVRRLASQRFIDSKIRLFGALPRDWQNAFCARYISLLDPLACAGRRYHLVQRSPRRQDRRR
jgi:GT2 family glycosyltransferase